MVLPPHQVAAKLADGRLRPLRSLCYSLGAAASALRALAQASHAGNAGVRPCLSPWEGCLDPHLKVCLFLSFSRLCPDPAFNLALTRSFAHRLAAFALLLTFAHERNWLFFSFLHGFVIVARLLSF